MCTFDEEFLDRQAFLVLTPCGESHKKESYCTLHRTIGGINRNVSKPNWSKFFVNQDIIRKKFILTNNKIKRKWRVRDCEVLSND